MKPRANIPNGGDRLLTAQDYNYRTTIGCLETKINIAVTGLDVIVRAAKELGEKYNIPEDELDKFRNGIWDLQYHLQQK